MMVRSIFSALILLLSISSYSQSSSASDSLNKKRLKKVVLIGGSTYIASMVGLNYLWYNDFEREPFHFFNDNSEWKQMDKMGHFFSTYQISAVSTRALQWAGVPDAKAHLWGSVSGLLILAPIEIFDGFSSAYGASWGDIIANSAGGVLHYGQYKLWQEQRVYPKWSFQRSGLAPLRPELLGSNLSEELLKDYNGQTYWLSVDLHKFMKNGSSRFPKWLNVSVGYGAENMLFASDSQNELQGYQSFRQYYVGIDFDLSHIKTHSGFVKALLHVVNMVHLPAPALEINDKGDLKLHALFF